jgi:hypothetical protein
MSRNAGGSVTQDSPAGEIPVEASGQSYVVQQRGSELHVGRRADGTVLWQDETIPVADLPEEARSALEQGRLEDQQLSIALESIVQAFVQRGG